MVSGLGFRIHALDFRVEGLEFLVQDLVQSLVWCLGFVGWGHDGYRGLRTLSLQGLFQYSHIREGLGDLGL